MKKIFAANWKLQKTPLESKEFCENFLKKTSQSTLDLVDVFIFPQNFSVGLVSQTVKGSSVLVGPQTVHTEVKGAFTGENSALLAKQFGCQLVLLGHSERRQYFHESNEVLNQKIKLTHELEMLPVLCIGETLEQRDLGQTNSICLEQLQRALHSIDTTKRIIIAYEPVWAIGTGRVATPEQVQSVHQFIFDEMKKMKFENFQILYGGSVKPDNAKSLIQLPHVDGFLIGGASLEVESFISVIQNSIS